MRLILSILFTCFTLISQAVAQATVINEAQAVELRHQIQNKKRSIDKVTMLLSLGSYLVKGLRSPGIPVDSASSLFTQAFNDSKILQFTAGEAESCLRLSNIAQIRHQYDLGKAFALASIDLFKKINEQDGLGEAYVLYWSNNALSGMPPPARVPVLQNAIAAFRLSGNKQREGDCFQELGDIFYVEKNFPKSLEHLQQSLALYQKVNYPKLMGVYDLLGAVYTGLGNYQEGVQYGLKAIRTAEILNDTSDIPMCTYYNRIGLAYLQLNDTAKSKYFFNKAFGIAVKFDDRSAIAGLCFHITEMMIRFGNAEEGLRFMHSVIRKYPDIGKTFAIEVNLHSINAYRNLDDYSKAAKHISIIETEAKRKDLDPEILTLMYSALISYYTGTHQYKKAADYMEKYRSKLGILKWADKYADYYCLQFRIDSATGKYISAIKNFQRYKTIKDSLLNETKSRQIAQFGVLYETEKKEKNIQSLQKSAELQQSYLHQADTRQNLILIGTGLLLVIAVLLFYSYRLKKNSNAVLLQQQLQITQKNEALNFLVTEKDWLMREIHHRVKNNLHMVVGLLASQAEYIKGKEALDAINESQHRVQAMSIIHQKLYQADNFSFTDMSAYIRELVDYLESSLDNLVRVRFFLDIDKVSFPLSHSIPVGLIINEGVTNSVKYAFEGKKEGEIRIAMNADGDGKYVLLIHDNGKGITDPSVLNRNATLGISLIKGLSADIKGKLQVENDNGLKLKIEFLLS